MINNISPQFGGIAINPQKGTVTLFPDTAYIENNSLKVPSGEVILLNGKQSQKVAAPAKDVRVLEDLLRTLLKALPSTPGNVDINDINSPLQVVQEQLIRLLKGPKSPVDLKSSKAPQVTIDSQCLQLTI